MVVYMVPLDAQEVHNEAMAVYFGLLVLAVYHRANIALEVHRSAHISGRVWHGCIIRLVWPEQSTGVRIYNLQNIAYRYPLHVPYSTQELIILPLFLFGLLYKKCHDTGESPLHQR